MFRIVLLDPKLTLMSFQQFPSRGKFFHFVNFWDALMRKEQQQPPDRSTLSNGTQPKQHGKLWGPATHSPKYETHIMGPK